MILKKKKINPEYLNEDLFFLKILESNNREKIEKFLLNKYRIGYKIDQKEAYNGKGSIQIIKGKEISIVLKEGYVNVSIGGTGIWHSKIKKLPKVISR